VEEAMNLTDKHIRFETLINTLDLSNEQAATLAATMEYGSGHEALGCALETLADNMEEDEEQAENTLDAGLVYLEALAKAIIDNDIHTTLE
jgi:hypothetical protein